MWGKLTKMQIQCTTSLSIYGEIWQIVYQMKEELILFSSVIVIKHDHSCMEIYCLSSEIELFSDFPVLSEA